jgi:hypothetical protein
MKNSFRLTLHVSVTLLTRTLSPRRNTHVRSLKSEAPKPAEANPEGDATALKDAQESKAQAEAELAKLKEELASAQVPILP